MSHLRGNIIASIDLETTGTMHGFHEIVQVAVVPLDEKLEPVGQPFYRLMRPDYPERADPKAFEINQLELDELANEADKERVADLLTEWIADLRLPVGSKIVPLAHNYIFENGFLNSWLGVRLFEQLFHYHPRDGMILALAIKDKCALAGLPEPFDSVGLENLCKVYGIVNEKPHDALADAIAEAKLYKAMLGVK